MLTRAGFGIRAVALLIDLVVLVVLSVILGVMAGGASSMLVRSMLPINSPGWQEYAPLAWLLGAGMALLGACTAFYVLTFPYNLMEALLGWTPGKLLTGLRVRSESGAPAHLGQMLVRWLIKHVGVLLALLSVTSIPFFTLTPVGQLVVFCGCFMALGASRQALHDRLTHTAIYEVSVLQQHAIDRGDPQAL